jgi:hypothetical protein
MKHIKEFQEFINENLMNESVNEAKFKSPDYIYETYSTI